MISEFINDIRRRLKKIITDDNMLGGSCSRIDYQLASRCVNTQVIEIYSYIQSSITANSDENNEIDFIIR